MTFNWEISLGAILQIAVLIVTAFGAFRRLGALEAKLNIMFDWFQSAIIRRDGPDLGDIKRFHDNP